MVNLEINGKFVTDISTALELTPVQIEKLNRFMGRFIVWNVKGNNMADYIYMSKVRMRNVIDLASSAVRRAVLENPKGVYYIYFCVDRDADVEEKE